jgi:hypothetical protein
VKQAIETAGGETALLNESGTLFARFASETNFVLGTMSDDSYFRGLSGVTNLGDVFQYQPIQPDRIRIRIYNSHFDTFFITLANPDRPLPAGFERIAGNVGFINPDDAANGSHPIR